MGCGGGLKTQTVQGKVVLADGDVKTLAGSNVEMLSSAADRTRAYGEIKEDGSFTMQTRHNGKTYQGVPPGNYAVRILVPDVEMIEGDDDTPPRPKGKTPIHFRFMEFASSRLTCSVPTSGDFTIKVSRK